MDRKAYLAKYFSQPHVKARNARQMKERYWDNPDIRAARLAYQVEYRAKNRELINKKKRLKRASNKTE